MSKYFLIVDDNPSDLVLTSFLVEKQGHISIKAKDGLEAFDKIDEFPINGFIIDLQMPNMSGLELIQRIRKQPRHDSKPILVMSARREERDIKIAIKFGSNDYIVKPLDPAIFEGKIISIFGDNDGWFEAFPNSAGLESKGYITDTIDIISISEIGVSFVTKTDSKIGSLRVINSPFLSEAGLENLQLCIKSVSKVENQFIVKASFLGLSDSLLKKLRILCKNIWATQNSERRNL